MPDEAPVTMARGRELDGMVLLQKKVDVKGQGPRPNPQIKLFLEKPGERVCQTAPHLEARQGESVFITSAIQYRTACKKHQVRKTCAIVEGIGK